VELSGKIFLHSFLYFQYAMMNLLGEYDCKVDAKGRLMLPSGLKKQLAEIAHEGFVVNRNIFEPCLDIFPMKEWDKVSEKLSSLNRFVRKEALFIRRFLNGATPLSLDVNFRVNLPASLMNYAGITRTVKVLGNNDRIEIWDKEQYEKMLSEEIDFASLAEEVMGNKDEKGE
jgi:MraZ protein